MLLGDVDVLVGEGSVQKLQVGVLKHVTLLLLAELLLYNC